MASGSIKGEVVEVINGTTPSTNISNMDISIKKYGRVICLTFVAMSTVSTTNANYLLCTLPTQARPTSEMSFVIQVGNTANASVTIKTTGEIFIYPWASLLNSNIRFTVSYIV